jgi:hypothetical protein
MLTAFLVADCSSIDCPVENTVRTYYNICNSDGSELKIDEGLSVTSKRRDGTDTLLLNMQTGISKFSLPVSYSHPEDILIFAYSSKLGDIVYARDTVWVKKDDIPHFESVDCNASFFHNITAVRSTQHAIDSIRINNPSVTYDSSPEHFHLYLKKRR